MENYVEQTDRVVIMLSPYTGGKVVVMRGTSSFYDKKTRRTYQIESEHYLCVDTQDGFTTCEQDDEWLNNVRVARRLHKLTRLGI